MWSKLKFFLYAIKGIQYGFLHERNVKIHGVLTVMVLCAGLFFSISLMEWFIVLLCIGMVISAELMNSAVEKTLDRISTEYHPLTGLAKDLAAGAVLVLAIISAIVGALIFVPKVFNWLNTF